MELFNAGNILVSSYNLNVYNTIISLHGLVMLFFILMPYLFGGFGNYFLPKTLGAQEVIYPRLNTFGYLLLVAGFLILVIGYLGEISIVNGWTLYPPVNSLVINLTSLSIQFLIIGLAISGVSSLLSSVNLIQSLYLLRVVGIELLSVSTFAWSIFYTGLLLINTLPFVTGAF